MLPRPLSQYATNPVAYNQEHSSSASAPGDRVSSLIPLFPLEVVLFPGTPLPLRIFEPRYKEMIGECLANGRPFGMVRVKESTLSAIGCEASIVNVIKKFDDGRMDIATEGTRRFEISQVNQERYFLQGEVT